MTTSNSMPLAVHSVERIVFTIPEIEIAEKFYAAFGMNPKRKDSANHKVLDIYTHGHPHRWMSVIANGEAKKIQYLSFGIYEADKAAFAEKISKLGLGCEPSSYASSDEKANGIWLKTPEGTLLQLTVSDKVSPNQKTQKAAARGLARPPAAAQMRTLTQPVHPRNLSHVLMFSADVGGMITFCEDVLGLKLSDRSVDIVAFMHTPHGSDHHLFAFVKSDGPGLHHTSWDVGSLDDVGEGSEQLRTAGYPDGWGVGRHVLGSNYFYYARDPWGSFAEYSFDIDFVPKGANWVSGDYPPEDSFYLWGPAVPEWFTVNTETVKTA
jgi:catechol 2,3-dioxygenase-like lactoylglutathione lyase family enzyme